MHCILNLLTCFCYCVQQKMAFGVCIRHLQWHTPAEAGLAAPAAGLACFCAGFLAGASFLAPSVLVAAAPAGLAEALADPPIAGTALTSAFSAHSFTFGKKTKSLIMSVNHISIFPFCHTSVGQQRKVACILQDRWISARLGTEPAVGV